DRQPLSPGSPSMFTSTQRPSTLCIPTGDYTQSGGIAHSVRWYRPLGQVVSPTQSGGIAHP
ncbi:unnamed protein product, partial [Candidula unifasciata]